MLLRLVNCGFIIIIYYYYYYYLLYYRVQLNENRVEIEQLKRVVDARHQAPEQVIRPSDMKTKQVAVVHLHPHSYRHTPMIDRLQPYKMHIGLFKFVLFDAIMLTLMAVINFSL